MATISVNGRTYPDIQLIAFDKDGTLVDFNHLWAGRSREWIEWLAQHGEERDHFRAELFQNLCQSLGFDPGTNQIITESPLAVTTLPKLFIIAAAVLYQHGLGWVEAEQLVQVSLQGTVNIPPAADEIRPLGRVKETIEKLVSAGIRMAVITNDDRSTTETIITLLGIAHLIELLVCGDDDIPSKPAPDGIWLICRQLSIQPSQMLMVGDTISDMMFGRQAGAAGCIGIRSGVGDQSALQENADEVIDTIEGIEVIGW